ncbi:hypothetical protein C4579_03340 [Candidatus Microgenomates bacterium]|nr:MAG: hypothetical protein C4579_03340 [Candidatus Microgenomates bacterium]
MVRVKAPLRIQTRAPIPRNIKPDVPIGSNNVGAGGDYIEGRERPHTSLSQAGENDPQKPFSIGTHKYNARRG